MIKTNIILIALLSCLSVDFYAQNNDYAHINSTRSHNLLVQQSALYIKKNALLIAITPILLFYHKKILNFMLYRPYISSLGFYVMLNYVCDSIANYQQQESLLKIISLLKKSMLYLVVCHGIKNHIQQQHLSTELLFDEQVFLNSITENLAYSFDEITVITLKAYQELKTSLQTLNIAINIESEEFVFLCHASSITMHSMLYLAQNDQSLYQAIDCFKKNPQTHLAPLLHFITSEITQMLTDIETHLLTLNMHPKILS